MRAASSRWRCHRQAGNPPCGLRCTAASPAWIVLAHLSVHEGVDDLCKRAASLCAPGEMLGIALAACAHVSAVTWENTIHILCIKGRLTFST